MGGRIKTGVGGGGSPRRDFHKCRDIQTGAGAGAIIGSEWVRTGEAEQWRCEDVNRGTVGIGQNAAGGVGVGPTFGNGATPRAVSCHHSPAPPETERATPLCSCLCHPWQLQHGVWLWSACMCACVCVWGGCDQLPTLTREPGLWSCGCLSI